MSILFTFVGLWVLVDKTMHIIHWCSSSRKNPKIALALIAGIIYGALVIGEWWVKYWLPS